MDKISSLKFRNPTELVRAIGARLREQRLARGWTQQELAERAGVGLSTLKLFEHEGKGSLQRLAKIAVALNLDGELRQLFAEPKSYESLDAVEASTRQRAPRRKRSS